MNDRTDPRYYHVEVDSSVERVGQMQRIVAAHLRYWGLQKLVTSATRGVGLLLEAAAAGPVERVAIETWWTGQHLITAVSHPDASEGGQKDAHPHLHQIATLSDGWGSCLTNNRRIVWFSLRKTDHDREPLATVQPEPWSSEALTLPQTPAAPGSAARASETAGTTS
ncbi:pep a2 [Streptomyces kunmingensis]|uniref:Pep a2 n=1 Tax=Streptomyces kunmingensis TaxID=68225 RepID=A0ABU6C8H2_9ACTN|nr:pep a2 [Streptomyces kunmingensis]MEB3960155.1 pep a2 [Streptomyces kunmingensis]